MQKLTKYKEDFLAESSKEITVDKSLPLKLQKRELLKKLGFPVDSNVVINLDESREEFVRIFISFNNAPPFIIGIHAMPTFSYITPFFLVKGEYDIEYQDPQGEKKRLNSLKEIINEIYSFTGKIWIEFVKSVWNRETIAGRLIYSSYLQQILEIQKGVSSKNIGNNREIYFYTELSRFNLSVDLNNSIVQQSIVNSGFTKLEINNILSPLRTYKSKFEKLSRISSLPTLEFAYDKNGEIIVIDVDWPDQYFRS